jgi:hypothetical protein
MLIKFLKLFVLLLAMPILFLLDFLHGVYQVFKTNIRTYITIWKGQFGSDNSMPKCPNYGNEYKG